MKNIIVTTSIYEPTEATIKYSKMENWTLVVVGDKKTPHDSYKKINCIYLSPEEQEKIDKNLSDSIGWNKITRRNLGFVYAYKQGAEIIATVDDDNIPYENWGKNIFIGKEIEIDLWESSTNYFDPLSVTNANDLWHRGYPIEYISEKNNIRYLGKTKRTPLIQADLWDGDPDIDAMCRIIKMPCIKFNKIGPFGSNQYSPFNSQNTFLHRDVIPYYMLYPHVGRMDDIWAGYNAQKHFKNKLIYNESTVYHARHKQDLTVNLENEMIGYKNTLNLIQEKISLKEISEKAEISYNFYKKSLI